jgi:hypothetical protein
VTEIQRSYVTVMAVLLVELVLLYLLQQHFS